MSGHTEGPWEIKRSKQGYPYQIYAPYGDDRAKGRVGQSVTRWGAISMPSSAESEANARLMAAAPELLAELQRLVAGGLLSVQADAVIAKATGTEPPERSPFDG